MLVGYKKYTSSRARFKVIAMPIANDKSQPVLQMCTSKNSDHEVMVSVTISSDV